MTGYVKERTEIKDIWEVDVLARDGALDQGVVSGRSPSLGST